MKLFATLCLLVVSICGTNLAMADGGCSKPVCCTQQPCQSSCKLLKCRPEVTTIKVSKTRFNVECDHLCIPAITFPWQNKKSICGSCTSSISKCFTPKCGKVIAVKVLTKEKYIVEKCVCKWNIEEVSCTGSCKPDCCSSAPLTVTNIFPLAP